MAEAFRVALFSPVGPVQTLLRGLAMVERLTLLVQAAWHTPVTQTYGSLLPRSHVQNFACLSTFAQVKCLGHG